MGTSSRLGWQIEPLLLIFGVEGWEGQPEKGPNPQKRAVRARFRGWGVGSSQRAGLGGGGA